MANLAKQLATISAKTKSRGGMDAQVALVSRRVIDQKNNVAFNPDHNVSGYAGATIATAPAVIFTDIVTGLRWAMVIRNGAPFYVQVASQ